MERRGDVSQTSQLSVKTVPPGSVGLVWQHVLPMIRRGLARGEGDSTTSDILRIDVERGDKILWAVTDGDEILAAVILNIVQHPAKRTLFVVLVAGKDMHRWLGMIQDLLLDFKDLVGADTVEASVRDGLTRWLSKTGWKRKATIMQLDSTGGRS